MTLAPLRFGWAHQVITALAACPPVEQGRRVDAKQLGPLRERLLFASKLHLSIGAAVGKLLLRECPLAVFRRIRAVVVDAVPCVLRAWARSKVGEPIRESARPAPPVADSYSARAVVSIRGLGGIVATADHASVRPVLRGARLAVRRACLAHRGRHFAVDAATRSGSSASQVPPADHLLSPAGAKAQPSGLTFGRVLGAAKDCQPLKFLSCEVYVLAHSTHRIKKVKQQRQKGTRADTTMATPFWRDRLSIGEESGRLPKA